MARRFAGLTGLIVLLLMALPFIVAQNGEAIAGLVPTPGDPLLAALERAWNFSGGNDDWEPFEWEFDGVVMVLVPWILTAASRWWC